MRNAFAEQLTHLAEENKNIVLLSGDIGNRLFDNYKKNSSDRFLNCGVAEQNMIGMAAGMALNGLRPIAYTITPFLTMRCFEQIKIDLCYHNLPVILVGVGSGLCYAALGATHQSCEDIGILRTLPNMTIICPGDAYEVKAALNAALRRDGPVYIRLGKKGEPIIHEKEPDFEIGKAITIKEGSDICLLSTGNMLSTAIETAEKLKENEISAQVVSFHTVKPLDNEFLLQAFSKFKIIVTLEEHSLLGGFGSAVSEWFANPEQEKKAKLIQIGTQDYFMQHIGDQDYTKEQFGMTPEQIIKKIIKVYK